MVMSSAARARKRRRPGQACDSCHRKKTRCHWRAPACVDCIRLDIPCTFERPQGTKAVDQDRSLQQHLQDVDPNPSQNNNARPTSHDLDSGDASTVLAELEIDHALSIYFTAVNHALPILSHEAFRNWHSDQQPNDPAFRTCLKSLLCASIRHTSFSRVDTNDQRHLYWDYLREALSNVGNLLVATPSLHAVQALASLVACVQQTADGAEKGLPILAVAIRFAHRLNLHHLAEEEGISVGGRLEQLRLFWCLYILDRSTSMRLHLPPIIDDADLYVLTPRMFSDDGLGLVRVQSFQSKDITTELFGLADATPSLRRLRDPATADFHTLQICSQNSHAQVNLFTARQRLVKISSVIWNALYTFSGERQPRSQRMAAAEDLQRRLLDWKAEWFDIDFPDTAWPEEHLPSIVHLQFEWFYCLLKADPETFPREPKSIAMMPADSSSILNLRAKVQTGTAPWVDGARETLRLATVVRKGGLNYLQYASHYIVPAILILSAASSSAPGLSREQAEADRELTKLWMDLFSYIVRGEQ